MSIEEAREIIERFKDVPMKEMEEVNTRLWWLAKATIDPIG